MLVHPSSFLHPGSRHCIVDQQSAVIYPCSHLCVPIASILCTHFIWLLICDIPVAYTGCRLSTYSQPICHNRTPEMPTGKLLLRIATPLDNLNVKSSVWKKWERNTRTHVRQRWTVLLLFLARGTKSLILSGVWEKIQWDSFLRECVRVCGGGGGCIMEGRYGEGYPTYLWVPFAVCASLSIALLTLDYGLYNRWKGVRNFRNGGLENNVVAYAWI